MSAPNDNPEDTSKVETTTADSIDARNKEILRKMHTYFDMFDGQENTLNAERQAIIDDFVDSASFQVVTPKGPILYTQWLDSIRKELVHGCKVTVLQARVVTLGDEEQEGEEAQYGIEYSAHISTPRDNVDVTIHSMGILDQNTGKLIRVQPIEHGDSYNVFLGDPTQTEKC
ncbi:hypothetical protein ACA910_010516 [Epithemia clementina (nom. ined.)]